MYRCCTKGQTLFPLVLRCRQLSSEVFIIHAQLCIISTCTVTSAWAEACSAAWHTTGFFLDVSQMSVQECRPFLTQLDSFTRLCCFSCQTCVSPDLDPYFNLPSSFFYNFHNHFFFFSSRLLCFYIFLEIHRYSHHLHQCTAALKKKKSGQKSACAGAELTHDGSLWICNKTDNPANGAGP